MGIGKVIAIFWTIHDPPGLQGLSASTFWVLLENKLAVKHNTEEFQIVVWSQNNNVYKKIRVGKNKFIELSAIIIWILFREVRWTLIFLVALLGDFETLNLISGEEIQASSAALLPQNMSIFST